MTHRRLMLAVGIVLMMIVTPAGAQVATTGWFKPYCDGTTLNEFLAGLEPDDARDTAVRALGAHLEQRYRMQSERVPADMRRAEDPRAVRFQWRRDRRGLEATFATDVRDAVGPRHAPAWTDLVRRLRRDRVLKEMAQYIPKRPVPDLVSIVEALTADSRRGGRDPDLDPAVADYAAELDPLLVEWEETIVGIERDIHAAAGNPIRGAGARPPEATSRPVAAGGEQIADREALDRLFNRLLQKVQRVIEINDRHAALFDRGLETQVDPRSGEAHAGPVTAALNRRRYPEFFRTSPAELALTALEALSLRDDQRARVERIGMEFRRRQRDIGRAGVAALESWNDPVASRRRQSRWNEVMRSGGDATMIRNEHPVRPLLVARRDLVLDACRRLRSVFTEAEFANLPLDIRVLLTWPN